MHIVQITTELRPAGAEIILLNLVRGLIAAGHRVTVISLRPLPDSSSVVDGLREAGAAIHALAMEKHRPWRVLRLRRLLRELSPDLVHAHLLHANLASRLAVPGKRGYPLINSVHIAERRGDKWWHFLLDRWTLRRCDCQTAVSQAVRRYHAEQLRIDSERIPVIYNGIVAPPSPSAERIGELRREWGMASCSRVLGSVGRLAPQKGYDVLLGMVEEIAARIPEGESWGLVLLGEGPCRQRLEQMASAAPERLRICLPGFRDDAASCAGAFDLFLMPSRYEGFGLVLAEAMAHGIPILANRVDSLPELLEDYPLGEAIDFALGNSGEVAEAIERLAGQPRGERVCTFGVEAMVASYLELYTREVRAKAG